MYPRVCCGALALCHTSSDVSNLRLFYEWWQLRLAYTIGWHPPVFCPLAHIVPVVASLRGADAWC